MSANLMTTTSQFVNENVIRALPMPKPLGARHKPYHPMEVIEVIRDEARNQGLAIRREQFAINPQQTKIIGTLDVLGQGENPDTEHGGSLGFMTAVDQSTSLRMVGGKRIWICENLMVGGEDVVSLKRKHTTGVDLPLEIHRLMSQAAQQIGMMDGYIEAENAIDINDKMAWRIVGEMLMTGVLRSASHIRDGAKLWFEPETEDVQNRTVWGLHQAYTREVQKMKAAQVLLASVAVGQYFANLAKRAQQPQPVVGHAQVIR